MQAQYFWEGHDPSSPAVHAATTEHDITVPRFLGLRGKRAAAHANANMCHVIAGPLIPIEPGEIVTTRFTMDEDSVWHASISTGSKISAIEVPGCITCCSVPSQSVKWHNPCTYLLVACIHLYCSWFAILVMVRDSE